MPLLRVEVERIGTSIFYVNQIDDSDEARDEAMNDARILAESFGDDDFDWVDYLEAEADDSPTPDRWIWSGGEDGDFITVGEFRHRPNLTVIRGEAAS